MKEVICYIGLGSNLEQPRKQILAAINTLSNTKGVRLVKQSGLYETKPMGFIDQPDFINAVVKLATTLSALELLSVLQNIELQQGRVRTEQRYGPRTIDLDLLLYGEQKINTKDLVVPHPRMLERSFVLEPLAELSRD